MKLKGTFLGTGASAGIPVIGCHCAVCLSKNEKNKRFRPSCLLTLENKKILIDAGPDFRSQALRYGIEHLDGVMITHTHYDHIGGLDDLRAFYIRSKQSLPMILSRSSYEDLEKRLAYLFREKTEKSSLTAQLDFQIIEDKRGETIFLGFPFHYMTYRQGGMDILGFRLGKWAYLSDIREYPETIFEDLQGVEVLIVSALRHVPSHLHFSIEEACAFIKNVGAKKGYLMHICHEIDHVQAVKDLPSDIELAYDGLEFECEL